MKKLVLGLFLFLCSTAHAAQIVNAEYVHGAIANRWGFTVPYNSKLVNPQVAVNMKYLLTTIDMANKMLGSKSEYGVGTYATGVAADTVATDVAIDTLIDVSYKFSATTVADTASFSFNISASGVFGVDWGDGTTEIIDKTNTDNITYSHDYEESGTYEIRIGGRATGYNSSTAVAAISFSGNTNLMTIDGSLGEVFSTLDNGSQPSFYNTFNGATNLTGNIPENLFSGISGAPESRMFAGTFQGCAKLTGEIPGGLFDGFSGGTASALFVDTFAGCKGLTGTIPEGLFAKITGKPVSYLFTRTFGGCTGLTGAIPEGLFSGVVGAPATSLFHGVFQQCSGLTGTIPGGLFAAISGPPAQESFRDTFIDCTGLTGAIPSGLFAGIVGPGKYLTFYNTFKNCTGLTGAIPNALFAGISGVAEGDGVFNSTFANCSGLTSIPSDLFGDISSESSPSIFTRMFLGCSGLTGPSAKINGQYLYDIWSEPNSSTLTFTGCINLSDYADIPGTWK